MPISLEPVPAVSHAVAKDLLARSRTPGQTPAGQDGVTSQIFQINDLFRKRFIAEPALFTAVGLARMERSRLLRKSGDTLQLSIPFVALVMTVFSIDVSSVTLIYSLVACVLTTHLLKYSLKLPRPNGGKHSFPSGHTSFAFVGASFIHLHFESTIAVLLYFCASYVALTRVITRKHYPRDVFAGAIIGTGSALIFSY